MIWRKGGLAPLSQQDETGLGGGRRRGPVCTVALQPPELAVSVFSS